MTTQVGGLTGGLLGEVPAPPVDPDAARYEALAKELEIEQDGSSGESGVGDDAAADKSAAASSAEPEKADAGEPAPKPAPTELDNLKTALKEAREAHKAEQARTDAILAALREAKDRRGQQQGEAEKTAAPKLPEVQEDPIGHFTGRIAQLEDALRQSQLGGQQQTQHIQAQLQEQQMWGAVAQAEADIRDPKNPNHKADYDDACNHLITTRARQLDRMYPNNSPQVIAAARQAGFQSPTEYKQALLNQDGRGLIVHALQQGISPAALLYDLAMDAGYQPKAAANGANGAQAQPTLAERAQQQIAAAKKGTKASVTLSGGDGGRKGAQDMSITDLADLFTEDPDAADKVWEQMRKAGKLG